MGVSFLPFLSRTPIPTTEPSHWSLSHYPGSHTKVKHTSPSGILLSVTSIMYEYMSKLNSVLKEHF